MISDADKLRFEECRRIVTLTPDNKDKIGRLGERTLHQILKYYFESDNSFHEVKVGRYVADICKGNEITEIQTRNFYTLRKKLAAYSEKYSVNVVFPIATTKYICWVNPESGELTSRRKSPRRGTIFDILHELYGLRQSMPFANVKFTIVLCETEDFRLLDGYSTDKKKGSARFERIPTVLCDVITLEAPEDYSKLIPASLGESFTAAEFARAAKMTSRKAGYALPTLVSLGVISHTSTMGRAYVYTKTSYDNKESDGLK